MNNEHERVLFCSSFSKKKYRYRQLAAIKTSPLIRHRVTRCVHPRVTRDFNKEKKRERMGEKERLYTERQTIIIVCPINPSKLIPAPLLRHAGRFVFRTTLPSVSHCSDYVNLFGAIFVSRKQYFASRSDVNRTIFIVYLKSRLIKLYTLF